MWCLYIVLGYRDPLGYSVEGRFAKQKNLSLLGVRGIYDFAGNHVFITPFLGAEFGVINDSKFCHKGSMYGPMVGVRKELKEIPFTLTTDFGVYKISMANTVASVDDWQFIVNCDVSFSLETFLNYFKRWKMRISIFFLLLLFATAIAEAKINIGPMNAIKSIHNDLERKVMIIVD